MIARLATRLRRDHRGATLVEFAMILPVMMTLIIGLGDMLFQQYAQSMLTGAVQKAGRDSSIQNADTSALDAKVVAMMGNLINAQTRSCPAAASGTYCSTRFAYDTFSEVGPEQFVDTNGDNLCNHNEVYTDVNNNGQWDANPGESGQGGASAVALYKMTMTYPRLFPVAGLLGWSQYQTITATTLLKNQPYASQTVTATTSRTCP